RRDQDGARSGQYADGGTGRRRRRVFERRRNGADGRDWTDVPHALGARQPLICSKAGPVSSPHTLELHSMHSARRILTIAATIGMAVAPMVHAQTYPTGNDPRNGLKPGVYDAGTAAEGL